MVNDKYKLHRRCTVSEKCLFVNAGSVLPSRLGVLPAAV